MNRELEELWEAIRALEADVRRINAGLSQPTQTQTQYTAHDYYETVTGGDDGRRDAD
jgi:hypothetical protein